MVGIELDVFVSDWFWDGKTEAEKVFTNEFAGAKGHRCLQHGKKHINARCSGGFKAACPTLIDIVVFSPPVAFHIAAGLLLQPLTHVSRTSAVALLFDETRTKSPFRFTTRNEMLSAKWVSSHDDCSPFLTCFAHNVVESSCWVRHLAQDETKKQMVRSLFAGLQR